MSKISELSDGGALLSTDDLIVVRSGGNVRAQLSSLNGIAIGSSTPAAGSFTSVSVDNITIDGQEIDVSSGDLTLDVAGDIILDADGGEVVLKDGSVTYGQLKGSTSDLIVQALVADKDIIFKGSDSDGASVVTALTLDMSAAGAATFNSSVTADGLTSSTSIQTTGSSSYFISNSSSSGDYIRLYAGSGTGKWDIYGNGANLRIGDNDSAGSVVIDTNVGIGLSSNIDRKLHVENNNDYAAKFGGTAGGDFAIEIGQAGTNGSPGFNATAGSMKFSMAGSEAMRINSSGHLLCGTTDAGIYDDATDEGGHNLLANGQYFNSTASEINMILNRQNSDGAIIQFRKDGTTTVGSIGTMNFGDMYLGTDDTGIYFNNGTDQIVPVNTTNQSTRDDAISLGASNVRFKDLYLAGGAYLGGTAAANKLDDYEEGTHVTSFTCSSSGTITINPSFDTLFYTKVGRLVTVNGRLVVSSASSPVGALTFTLPFAALNGTDASCSVSLAVNSIASGSVTDFWGEVEQNGSRVVVYYGGGTTVSATAANKFGSGTDLRVSVTYTTS